MRKLMFLCGSCQRNDVTGQCMVGNGKSNVICPLVGRGGILSSLNIEITTRIWIRPNRSYRFCFHAKSNCIV